MDALHCINYSYHNLKIWDDNVEKRMNHLLLFFLVKATAFDAKQTDEDGKTCCNIIMWSAPNEKWHKFQHILAQHMAHNAYLCPTKNQYIYQQNKKGLRKADFGSYLLLSHPTTITKTLNATGRKARPFSELLMP